MKNEKMRPYTVMCTDIYLLIMLVVFPLYYADGYFHLPERKAEFYSIATLIYIIVTLLGVAITAFAMKEQWGWEAFKKNITMTDVFMFGFLICNLIALAISDDKMNSWTGQSSRYYGAKVLLLVCLVYFMVSRYGWMNKVFIWAFLIGGNGVCLLATFDYFGMDVLGINQQMQLADWMVFISTMGNANTCASYVCITLVGVMTYFCVCTKVKEKIVVGISIMNCVAALITARSDSAFVGVISVVILLGIFTLTGKVLWKNYIIMLGLMNLGLIIFFLLRKKFVNQLLSKFYDSGLPAALNQLPTLYVIFTILVILYVVCFFCEKKMKKLNKKAIIVGTIILVSGVSVVLINKFNILNLFHQGLGREEVLTPGSRMYTYTRVVQAYGELPLYNKIFGCGQSAMTSVLYQYFGEELSAAGISINSAHNNILDYLIITGFSGVVCYLGIIIFAVKHALSVIKENKNALVFGLVVVAYFAQGIFNIDQTTTTTVFWLMIGCCEAMYRENVVKKNR